MTIRFYTLLYALGFFILLFVAGAQTAPGYMDAEYYFAGALQLIDGQGFSEPYLWNYLSDPQGLPTPSHTYWMPLASILAALGMAFSGAETFTAARLPFILLAAAVPPLTAALSYSLRPRRDLALLAGMLAAIPGFYLPFLSTTATFAPYMFFGAVFFLLVRRLIMPVSITHSGLPAVESTGLLSTTPSSDPDPVDRHVKSSFFWTFNQPFRGLYFSLGLVAGLMYLTRSDGLFYLLLAVIVAFIHTRKFTFGKILSDSQLQNSTSGRSSLITDNLTLKFQLSRINSFLTSTILVLIGFLIPTGPWFIRNLILFSSPFPPGVSQALWLTYYDQLFSYPASILTFESWWSSGIYAILQARLWSLSQNLQTTLGVQGMVFLFPLIVISYWRLRHNALIRLGVLAYLLTLLVMTIVFPFAGARGGFFHSGAAFQPLFWALAPIGLETFVSWGARRRSWIPTQALEVFSLGMIALAMMFTGITTLPKLLLDDSQPALWNQGRAYYIRLEAALAENGAYPGDIVMVNNPPGYYLVSERPAIVIPNGDLSTTLATAAHFNARYLLLDHNRPRGLADLYQQPSNQPGLQYLTSFESTHIFEIMEE
jgi:hypothetical protein